MSIRDFFVAFASAFAPMAVNDTVHDMNNIRQAAINAPKLAARAVKRRHDAWEKGDRTGVERSVEKQNEIMSGLDDLTERLNKR